MKTQVTRLFLLGSAASFVALTSLHAQAPNHRWTFNNTLVDSGTPGGSDAQVTDADGNAATGGGSTQNPTSVSLAGGVNNESDYIDLGGGLLSGAPGDVTIELWATRDGVQNWGRIFDFGNRAGNNGEDYLLMSWSIGTNGAQDRVEWREVTPDIGGTRNVDNTNAPYTDGTEFHIAMNIRPGAGAGGETLVEWRSAPTANPDLGAVKGSFSTPNTLASLNDVNGWLGRSQWAGDATANATYNEARIFYRKMTPEELESYHDLGPDNIVHPDVDLDGLPEWWEVKHSLADNDDGTVDPNNGAGGDPDGDGADNATEFAACTDPNNALSNPNDTDGDLLDDAWELANFGNLGQDGSGDPDGDTINNEDEETAGTDPNDAGSFPDSDSDGLPDAYENAIWGNTTTSTGTSDTDGDTYNDLEEFLAGTPPNDGTWSPGKVPLRHRWSFNGDLLDSAGGSNAQILDIDNNGATGGGSDLTTNPGEVRLFGGGAFDSEYVSLGSNLLGGITHDVTLEFWATQHGVNGWSRIFSFGANTNEFIMASWTRGNDPATSRTEYKDVAQMFIDLNEAPAVYPLGVEHHIVVQYDNDGAGNTVMTLFKTPSGEPDLGASSGATTIATTLALLSDPNDWLGRAQFNDGIANASYNEVRIYNGLVSPKVLEQLHDQGSDDPVLQDSDGDCLPDFWEIANGLDHMDANGLQGAFGDPDNDTVNNRDEYAACTPPTDSADSDFDGLNDQWEVDNFGNLSQDGTGDPDGDLATNEEEETAGTDPNDGGSFPDGDGDGLPDGYEIAIWGNTSTATATSDNDGDTFSDLEEFLAGTPPDNGNFSPNKAELRHRWSFNGDLVDTVGGSNAQILDADGNAGTGGLSDLDLTNPGEVRLFGGGQVDSDYVLLGNSLLGGIDHDVTLEFWATQHGNANWSRIFSFGSGTGDVTSVLMEAWTRGTNPAESRIEWRAAAPGAQFILDTNEAPAVYPLAEEHHIVVHFDNNGSGGTQVTLYKSQSADPDLGSATGTNAAAQTLQTLADTVNWLGRSQFTGDPTANASYNEVRIYNGLVNPKVLEHFHDQGVDAATLADSDGDCLPDFWEIANTLNETSGVGDDGAFGDPDGDGIINRDEFALCTAPRNADTDGDGLDDDDEVAGGTDPLNSDTDGDGLSDLAELGYGLDPLVAGGTGPLVIDGGTLTTPGTPLTEVQNIANGVEFGVIYSRPDNYAALGLVYTAEFSHDLVSWFPGSGPSNVVATGPGVEAVNVNYPFFLPNGRKARFWRIVITTL